MAARPIYYWVRKAKGRKVHHAVQTIPDECASFSLLGAACGWYCERAQVLIRHPEEVPQGEPICVACLRDIDLDTGYARSLKEQP